MESERSAKRRRLDTAQDASNSSPTTFARGNVGGEKEKKSHSNGEHTMNGQSREKSSAPSARDTWKEAKAKIQTMRGKKSGKVVQQDGQVDVYDDIEGAHSHESPLKKTLPSVSTPTKKQLDPLRNQKAASGASPSPSRGTSSLGFFKRFQQPKSVSSQEEQKSDGKIEKVVNGTASREHQKSDRQASAGAEQETAHTEVEEAEPAQVTPVKADTRPGWKGWDYATQPKKTFEDEIRELETAARQRAENEDEADASSVSQRRKRLSAPKADARSLMSKDEKKPAKAVQPKRPQSSAKRKTTPAHHDRGVAVQVTTETDDMEMNDAEQEPEPIVNGVHAKLKAAQATTPIKVKPQVSSKPKITLDFSLTAEHLSLIQDILLQKITGKRPVHLTNVADEYAKVSNLIGQTISAGESNSMLLIGARGSGKSALVNQILREKTLDHPKDFHIVRLNGFIHSDDKIALREIWRQLGREMELEDEESTSKNYADTLTTLLALLSHPTEHGQEQNGQVTKSVVFVLDEFELFASHPRQTLLYNLFDIAQSRKAPIAVLGLTTRVDVAESLEKRVKSRFSHRYAYLSLPKSFTAFEEACKVAIVLRREELTPDERERLGASNELNEKLGVVTKTTKRSALSDWNALLDSCIAHEDFQQLLHRLYYTTKSVLEFQTSMILPITTMPTTSVSTGDELFEHLTANLIAASLRAPDSKFTLLSSLSTLQLALLICAARLTAIYNTDTVPFAQAYEEYKVLASKAKLQASASGALAQGAGSRIWSKEVSKGAWEELIELRLVMEDGSRGYRVDVGLEEIGMSGADLGSWGRWCKEI